mmetsp:Transcript_113542/g.315893  ORF Transcript_113542/g.315893 Transcript_113542/m.315893 type:complete len:201 (+) Transcript_113542:275-877(+)
MPSKIQKTVTALPHCDASALVACMMPYVHAASKQPLIRSTPDMGQQPCTTARAILPAACPFWRSPSSVRPSLSYFSASTPWLIASTRSFRDREEHTRSTPCTPTRLPKRWKVVRMPAAQVRGTRVEYQMNMAARAEFTQASATPAQTTPRPAPSKSPTMDMVSARRKSWPPASSARASARGQGCDAGTSAMSSLRLGTQE